MAMTISWTTYIDAPDKANLTGSCVGKNVQTIVIYNYNQAVQYNGSVSVSARSSLCSIIAGPAEGGGTDFWELANITKVSDSTNQTWMPGYTTEGGVSYLTQYTCLTDSSKTPSGTVVFQVHLKRRAYKITYQPNGGSPAPTSPKSYYAGVSTKVTLPRLTKANYTFAGWYDNDRYSGNDLTGTVTIPTTAYGDKAYYAKFTQTTVTFDPNGGSVSPTSASGAEGQTITTPVPTLYHYVCTGWSTVKGNPSTKVADAGGAYSIPETDITLYALWETAERIVLFDPMGGSVSPYYSIVYQGEAYGTLPTPTYSGRTFSGWYTAQSGGTRVTASTIVTAGEQHILYARWNSVTVSHTLTFDTNYAGAMATKSVLEGDQYGVLPSAARPGHSFVGWFTATVGGTQVSSGTVMGQEDVTVYAHWDANELTVSFDPTGGTVSPDTKTVRYGAQVGRLPVPRKGSSTFLRWELPDGNELMITYEVTSDITVKAVWTGRVRVIAGLYDLVGV